MAKKAATRRAHPTAKRSPASTSSFSDFCRSLPHTTEDVKWGDNLIFSVGGKMYAGFELDNADEFAFKCDEEDFERLTQIDGVIPAPYAARFGWVKVMNRRALSIAEGRRLLKKAHELVFAGLPAGVRKRLSAKA